MKVFQSVFIMVFCCVNLLAQQNIRVSYAFLHKRDVTEKNFQTDMDMKLDFNGKESYFYSEGRFLRDSLSVLAFDMFGNTKDQVAYNEAVRHRGTTDFWHVNYSVGEYEIGFNEVGHVFIGEGGKLELPQWTLVEMDSSKTFGGYEVKMAEADYLGRHWTAWYTEEIPVNTGPWLLWGCPGLIVYAIDSESIFNFYILNLEQYDVPRWPDGMKAYTRNSEVRKLSVKELEKVKTRARRDVEYRNELWGLGGSVAQVRRRDGSIEPGNKYLKFQPLISESYWK